MTPSETTVTYGIIGVGLMGIEHIRNLLQIPDAIITCIADDYPGSLLNCLKILEEQAEKPPVKIFNTATALFASNLCQVAIIATPNHTHRQVLTEAYRHADPNMHILVEKPLCTTIEHCRDVIVTAEKRPGFTYVGLEYSYMPPVTRIIADTKKGLIGSPKLVAIREHRFPFLKKIRDWNRFSCNTGGTFVEKCCHFFDLFNRILGPQVPVTVMASGAQDVNHLDEAYGGKKPDILDNGYVIVEYSGGSRACLDLCMFAEASNSQEEISIVGSKGKLEAFLPQLEVWTGVRGEHECGKVKHEVVDDARIKYRGHHHGSSFLEHLDILNAVHAFAAGQSIGISTSGLYQGLMSVAVGVAAQLSIEEKRFVQITELLTDQEIRRSAGLQDL